MGELAKREAELVDQPHHLGGRKFPDGWEPSATLAGDRLVIVNDEGVREGPDQLTRPEDVCRQWGYDPDCFVLDRVEHKAYTISLAKRDEEGRRYTVAETAYSQRASFLVRPSTALSQAELDELLSDLRPKPKRRPKPRGGAFVPIISDLQIGKPDGDGVEGTKRRFKQATAAALLRARAMKPDRIVIPSLGDLVEGCDGHYPMQSFSVELDGRQQSRTLRKMLATFVTEMAKVAPVEVWAVPGNHGERRKDGKAFTTFGDNEDVAVWEVVAERAGVADRDDITIHVTDEELALAIDVEGLQVGLIHGHQAKQAGSPQAKVWAWWKGQQAADTPVGRCQLLLSGHLHHESMWTPTRGRTMIQVPAMDGGSSWWRHSTGMTSDPGMTMLEIRDGRLQDYHVEWLE